LLSAASLLNSKFVQLHPDNINIFVKILTIPELRIYKNSVNWAPVSGGTAYFKNQILFV